MIAATLMPANQNSNSPKDETENRLVAVIAARKINGTNHSGTPGIQYWTIFAPAIASNPTMITQKYQYSQPTEKPAQPPSHCGRSRRTTRWTGWPPPSRPASA